MIKIYAEVLEEKALEQFNEAMKLECNVQGALMPDAHAGYVLPIGSVIKSKGKIFPAYVGYDIGCGMSAVRLDIKKFLFDDVDWHEVKNKIIERIPVGFNVHTEEKKIKKYEGCSEIAKEVFGDLAKRQLGTLGSGNHFIEIGFDSNDKINIVVHSGSRGVGAKIAKYYMQEARLEAIKNFDAGIFDEEFAKKNDWRNENPEGWEVAKREYIRKKLSKLMGKNIEGHYGFDIDSKIGKEYLNDLNEALQFALDNREVMIETIVEIIEEVLGMYVFRDRFINRNHNHAEVVDGYVIHRKGATHAEKGMFGVIPGDMKNGSFIVKGKGNKDSMSSSSHGAGRILSRGKAKEILKVKDFNDDMVGIITNHSNETIDESPRAYKNIFDVMECQKDLVSVVDRVIPLVNIKG